MNTELAKLMEEPKALMPVVLPAEGAALPEPSLQELANGINHALEKAVDHCTHIGQLLIAAKHKCKHGEWEKMFKGHPKAIACPLRISVDTALQYMKPAAHPLLSNPNMSWAWPSGYRARYELSFFTDADLLSLVASGDIHPEISVAQVVVLRNFCSSTPRVPLSKKVRHRLASDAHLSYKQELDEADIHRFFTLVAAELNEPVRMGADGQLQSSVKWPPLGRAMNPTPRHTHQCECGHVHDDHRVPRGD